MTARAKQTLEMLKTEEQVKNENESPEFKEELTEEELKGVDGGVSDANEVGQ